MLKTWSFRRQLSLVAAVAVAATVIAVLPALGMFLGYDRIAGQVLRKDLPEIGEWAETVRTLAGVHSEFISLVTAAEQMDANTTYRLGSRFPDKVAELEQRIARLAASAADSSGPDAALAAVLAEASHYRGHVLTGVDMLNFNRVLSERHRADAGLAFSRLNQALADHLQGRQRSLDERLDERLQQFELVALLAGALLLVLTPLMVIFVTRIARRLDGNFSAIRESLHRLGAGRYDLIDENAATDTEMGRIGGDLARFRDALVQRDLSRQLMDAIFRHILEAVVVIDRQGRIQQVNPVADRMFGHPSGSLAGQPVDVLMPAPHAGAHAGYLSRYLAGGAPRILGAVQALEGLHADGHRFPIRLAVNEVEVAGEALFVGVIIDMSDIVAREEALRRARDDAQAASRAKSDFLANMSHEIRTPMNGIIGMADLALDAAAEAERIEYMRIVKSSAESLLGIINDILDFSKIEAGKLGIERIPFDLRTTCVQALQPLQRLAAEKGLAFDIEIADAVPALAEGDPTRLRQILLNLTGNAIKFTPRGGITVGLNAATTAGGIDLELTVSDTGIGIPADKLAGIFEAFTQADASTTRQYGGTGLGLSITRRLADLMGGTLEVDSAPVRGSRFTVRLPLGTPQASAGAGATASGPDPAATPPLDVLLVEDNAINQQLALRLLEKWGHRPVLATHGAEAVAHVAGGARFDLVLMDMQMPVMGGLEATRRIRALEVAHGRPPLRIVAMTANAMADDRDACLAAGMDDFLSKPIDKAQLAARLADAAAVEAVR